MKRKNVLICGLVCLTLLIGGCTIRSDKKISDDELEELKEDYEEYLEETYPGESFTVEVWQEYGERVGGAGLPDYEGYLLRQVITDSEGNRFKIFDLSDRDYTDDYQDVLDGKVHYNEKGQRVFLDDDGEVLFVDD